MKTDYRYYPVRALMDVRSSIKIEKMIIDNSSDKSGLVENLFESRIRPILATYRPVLSTLSSHRSHTIYRARKCNGTAPFAEMKELYNPPAPSGRAFTEESTPILYASSSFQTALSEIEVKIDDLVTIAQFSYEAIMNHKFWFVGQLGSYYKSSEQSSYLGELGAAAFHAYIGDQKAVNSLVYMDLLFNEVFSKFSSEHDNYILNRFLISAINEMVATDDPFSGVVFKSSKDFPGTNFAIFGEAISNLKPNILNLLKVTGIDDYGCIEYRLLKNASPKNEPIEWPEEEMRSF